MMMMINHINHESFVPAEHDCFVPGARWGLVAPHDELTCGVATGKAGSVVAPGDTGGRGNVAVKLDDVLNLLGWCIGGDIDVENLIGM